MEPLLGMIVLFAGNFAPRGWQLCWGQIMAISQNTALFSILGTTYGGNGQTTFALPDLQGRTPVGTGAGPGLSPINLGQSAGAESVTLTINQMPAHTHVATVNTSSVTFPASSAAGTTHIPGNTVSPAQLPTLGSGPSAQPIKGYGPSNGAFLAPGTVNATVTINPSGGTQPFPVRNPYLGMSL